MNWIAALFNKGRRQPFLNRFIRRRNNKGVMWGSLLVLGISAAVFGLGRNRNKNMVRPIQNLKNNFRMEKGSQKLNLTGLTEFAKELIPDKNQFTKK
ncbi:hypothetical protein [Bacillus methanolicus]|uniref:Putative membrane protein n=1 Tax=Bacillus methanolicus (strain MGA3 / ATCC 53907) TaxID=796606 RepID=I3DZM3_BACMM|nr:hypothetical protein [Bacillus methanolicus]AIE59758.1 putative membrane protein [Bacillus methanolicus MGA3]EIJ79694.1 hypothetical protein MGA3_15111 [Bacillus methanolicus MGA3]